MFYVNNNVSNLFFNSIICIIIFYKQVELGNIFKKNSKDADIVSILKYRLFSLGSTIDR